MIFNGFGGAGFPAPPFCGGIRKWHSEKMGIYSDPFLHPYRENGVYYLQKADTRTLVTLPDFRPGGEGVDVRCKQCGDFEKRKSVSRKWTVPPEVGND